MHLQPDGPVEPSSGPPGRCTDPGTSRAHRISDTFVDLAGALARGEDVVGLLELLTARCAELLGIATAGLLLADGRDTLHVLAASSMEPRDLEVLQARRAEGPAQDCYRTGRRVVVADLGEQAARWPGFVPGALQAGFRSVHAVPLRRRSRTLGVLGLFGVKAGALIDRDLSLAQGLADVASIALTQDHQLNDDVTAHVQAALDRRAVVEQAKGFLAQHGNVNLTRAFEALLWFADDRGLALSEVARAVVTGALPAAALLGADGA